MAQVASQQTIDETQALANDLMEGGESISTNELEQQANQLVQQANAVMGTGASPEAPPQESKQEIAQLVGKLKELTGAPAPESTLAQLDDNTLVIGN